MKPNLECNCFESGVSGHNSRCVFYGKTPREIADMFRNEITVETYLQLFALQRFNFSIRYSESAHAPYFMLEKEIQGANFGSQWAMEPSRLKSDPEIILEVFDRLLSAFWEQFHEPEFDIRNYATGEYTQPS